MTNIKILNDYITYISVVKNYSKLTAKEYSISIKLFFEFIVEYLEWNVKIEDINVFLLSQVTRSDIIAYLNYLGIERNNGSKSRNRAFASIRSFFNWLYAKYNETLKEKKNPANIKIYTEDTLRLPKYLSLNRALQLQTIYNANNSRYWQRNNAIITLFLNTGLRLAELENLNISNLDFNNKIIKNVTSKGNKERTIFLTEKAIKSISLYLDTRNDNNIALFISERNTRLSKRAIQDICFRAYKLAGLEGYNYSVHTLRHTVAVHLYRKNKDILLLKEVLGHERITTTEIYTHVENDAIKNAVERNPLSEFMI